MDKKQNAFAALRILHLSMLIGIFVFAGVAIFVTRDQPLASSEEGLNRTFQGIAAILSLGALVIGYRMFSRKILAIRTNTANGIKRMDEYRKVIITWWALIEGPALFAIICFMLVGNYAFLALAGFHFLLMLLFAPRKDNIILLLNLSGDEVKTLEEVG